MILPGVISSKPWGLSVDKQALWDAIAALADYGHGPRTTNGKGGFFKETTFTTQCSNGDECNGLKSLGGSPPSVPDLPFAGSTSLTPSNALVWWKDLANTTGLMPVYVDRGNWDKYLRFLNGPVNVSYYESNPGSFSAITHPLDFILALRYYPHTSADGNSVASPESNQYQTYL